MPSCEEVGSSPRKRSGKPADWKDTAPGVEAPLTAGTRLKEKSSLPSSVGHREATYWQWRMERAGRERGLKLGRGPKGGREGEEEEAAQM
jgi:hypothetical protein